MSLENGKTIEINAPKNSTENRYIQQIDLNGKEYGKNYYNYSELMKGAKINIEMGAKPNMNRGTKDADFPYSFSKNK